jgi:para-aminobenzoate synthetase component I
MEREKIILNTITDVNVPDWLQTLEQNFKNKPFCILNSNGLGDDYETIVAAGSIDELLIQKEDDPFERLRNFHQKHGDWIFGYLNYDLKNKLEKLTSENPDGLTFPLLYFFCPEYLFFLKKGTVECLAKKGTTKAELALFFEKSKENLQESSENENKQPALEVTSRISREQYISTIMEIKSHIQKGDIYEMNFCQEFFVKNVEVEPFQIYQRLNDASPTPFSCYFHANQQYLACASPERYLKKSGSRVISQPIKGTIKRGTSIAADEKLKSQLKNDPKEQSENVMIVDLVRNDLSRTAARGSVKVDELFGIYSFKQVHHMISTISSELKAGCDFVDLLKTTFPMGSMTGAPKIRAMEIIEQYESMKRGLFSGAVGYITPKGDMDFNVVIRSIFYNADNKYLSFMAGSAITINAQPEKEYEECILKAKAIFSIFK